MGRKLWARAGDERRAESLFSVPIITPARGEELLGVSRPTAQAGIDALVAITPGQSDKREVSKLATHC